MTDEMQVLFSTPITTISVESSVDDHHDEDKGYLENSDAAQEATRFGVSKVADWGYVGLAVSSSESLFGVPFHGEEHEEHEGEHEEERIFSNTESDKLNIRGQVGKMDFFFQDSEYSHTEQHAEEEHGDDDHEGDPHGHGEEGPTTFSNDSSEFGFIYDISNEAMTQKISLNSSEETVKIFGEEAFMNPADREELTIGYFARRDFDMFELSFGLRYDQIDTSGSVSEHHDEEEEPHDDEEEHHEEETTSYNFDSSNLSFAVDLSRPLNDTLNLNIGYSNVERAPSVVELFMNGPHLATGRFEEGDVNLGTETSNNFDIGLSFESDNLYASVTFFRNDVDNYIYLMDLHDDHDDHPMGAMSEDDDDHDHMTHHHDPFMVCHDTYMDAKHHDLLSRTYHLWKCHFHHAITPIHASVAVLWGVWVGSMTSLRLYRAILHSNSIGATLYELIWAIHRHNRRSVNARRVTTRASAIIASHGAYTHACPSTGRILTHSTDGGAAPQ